LKPGLEKVINERDEYQNELIEIRQILEAKDLHDV